MEEQHTKTNVRPMFSKSSAGLYEVTNVQILVPTNNPKSEGAERPAISFIYLLD